VNCAYPLLVSEADFAFCNLRFGKLATSVYWPHTHGEYEMFDYMEELQKTAVAIHTPLDALFGEYRKKRADIERIASFVKNDTAVINYFIEGATAESRHSSLSAQNLFDPAPAIRCLDAEFWSRAIHLTDVLDAMNADRRNEWHEQIEKHKTPAFEPKDVIETLRALLAQREVFFTERVCGVFAKLSSEHVTNSPQAFSRRLILGYLVSSYGGGLFMLNSRQTEYLHDLRCVIAKFMGRDAPLWNATDRDLSEIVKARAFGEWFIFDGGAFKVRLYMRGTAHVEVHPDIAWRLNRILANKFPNAIPESFRRQPVKTKKKREHEMRVDLVSFEAIATIKSGLLNRDGCKISFTSPPKKSAIEILEYLGGVNGDTFSWYFDYDITSVLAELSRTGALPEKRSHQFYGTPDGMASDAVEWAEIGEEDVILEPEAGQGGLAQYLPKDRTTCVEISPLHCAVLRAKGFNVVCYDFLDWNDERLRIGRKLFSRIVMNPPFSDGRAERHVLHASTMLAPNGILVAILPASFKEKKFLKGSWSYEWSEVRSNEFECTSVSVVLLKARKLK